jgi:signal transduction histidine kinase
MDAMQRPHPTTAAPPDRAPGEYGLLTASGVAAVAVVVWVTWQGTGQGRLFAVHLLFAALFVAAALDRIHRPGSRFGPLAVLLMLLLNVVALALFPYQITLILAVVLAASAPYHLSPRHSWLLLFVANAAFLFILYRYDRLAGEIPGLLSLLALQVFAASSSQARRREERARLALAVRNEELQAARTELQRQSQAAERLRIAGALHDNLGHRLTALQLQLEVLAQEAPPALRAQLGTCKQLAVDLLEEVRAIVRRMPGSEETDLRAVLDGLAASTPGVELSVPTDLPALAPSVAQQLAFCCQEAVHNAVRHGGADRIEIHHCADGFLVDDNGSGLDEAALESGFGLRNMDQRLKPFGGHVRLEAGPGGRGCRLRLQVPGEAA